MAFMFHLSRKQKREWRRRGCAPDRRKTERAWRWRWGVIAPRARWRWIVRAMAKELSF